VSRSFSSLRSSMNQLLKEDLWRLDLRQQPRVKAFFLRHLRIGILVIKRFIQHRVRVRASALVYATLMAIVPLLAVIFSLLKGFGYHNRLEPFLTRVLVPLGDQAIQAIVPTVMNFIGNTRVAALGAIGFLVFFISSLSIFKNMEQAFNDIWDINQRRGLRDYLSGLTLVPVMIFIVLTVTASLRNFAFVRTVSDFPLTQILQSKAAPLITIWIVFFVLLIYVPNTKVRFVSALYGAVIAGTVWQLLNFYFTQFFVGFYQKGIMASLYASFVVFPLFLIWLYFSWVIVLLGTEITYVHQNLGRITWETQSRNVSWRTKEFIALKAILVISQRFYRSQNPPTQTELADYLDVPDHPVSRLLSVLSDLGLVNAIGKREVRYVPARRLEAMSLREILDKLRNHGALFKGKGTDDALSRFVEDLQVRHENQLNEVFADTNLRDLLDRMDEGTEMA